MATPTAATSETREHGQGQRMSRQGICVRRATVLNQSLMKFISILFLAAAVSIGASSEPLLDKPSLVSTDWLAERIDHPEIRVVDARSGLGAYIEGHLPGAIYLNTETVRISAGGVPARLLPPEQLAELLEKLGIGNDHTVVIYSSSSETFSHATYVAFLLEWLGHEAIGVLDGGFEKWQAEDRELTDVFSSYERAVFEPDLVPEILLDTQEVQTAAANESAALLDARPPQAFETGRIPTARSFFLDNTLEGDEVTTWKSPEQLRALATEAGVSDDEPVITYCTSGRQSSQIYFSLRHVAGLSDVASYEGSWIEWTARETPVESAR